MFAINKVLKELNKYTKAIKSKSKYAHIEIEVNNKTYYIQVIKAAKKSIITLNAKNYFEGYKFSKKTYLLANSDLPNKIYIIYPSCKLLRKYINECEMEIIQKDLAFGMYFFTFIDLPQLIEVLLR